MTYRPLKAALALSVVAFGLIQAAPVVAGDAPPAAGAPAPMNPQTAYLAANIKKPGWKATASGLQYRVVKSVPAASGPKPTPGTKVTVHYEGTFIDGSKFDSSYEREEPVTFPLSNVIPGWQEGVPLMREGETWEFAIPSDLAYGSEQRGPIPGGSVLLFKVRLLWVATPLPEAAPAAKPAAAKPAAAKPAAKPAN